MFIEECAKTPRLSTEPILALHPVGRLEVEAPGETSRIDTAIGAPCAGEQQGPPHPRRRRA